MRVNADAVNGPAFNDNQNQFGGELLALDAEECIQGVVSRGHLLGSAGVVHSRGARGRVRIYDTCEELRLQATDIRAEDARWGGTGACLWTMFTPLDWTNLGKRPALKAW